MPFFLQRPSLTIVGVGACVIVCARHFAIAAEDPSTVVSRCEVHDEGCDAEEQIALREDDVKGLDLLQVDLRLHSNSVLPVSRQPITQEFKANPPLPDERFVEDRSTKSTKVAGKQFSAQIEAVVPPSSSSDTPLRADKGQIDHNERHNVSAVVSDVGFHSPLRVFSSMLEVSSHVNPTYSHAHQHRRLTEFFIAMQRLTVSGSSTSNYMGSMPILVVLSLVVCIMLLICVAGILRREQKSDRLQYSGATAAMQTPFANRGDLSRAVDNRLPSAQGFPPAQASMPPGQGDQYRFPPICPALILPHTEARFTVPIESLMKAMKAGAVVDIKGTSGRKLLHGSVDETSEGSRKLTIASCGHEDDPRVTVLAPPRSQPENTSSGPLEIYGKNSEFYGTLQIGADGLAVVHNREAGGAVMTLRMDDFSQLSMVALQANTGDQLAIAGKNVQVSKSSRSIPTHDNWNLQVGPNCDAVLISACMLAYIVLLTENE